MKDKENSAAQTAPATRLPWTAPKLAALPRLTELTLQSSIPGAGFIGDGGSTVF